MTDNVFEIESNKDDEELNDIKINGTDYTCSDDTAAIVHALICIAERLKKTEERLKKLTQLETQQTKKKQALVKS